jgi:tetratricopeptide (TPR) repeat protein
LVNRKGFFEMKKLFALAFLGFMPSVLSAQDSGPTKFSNPNATKAIYLKSAQEIVDYDNNEKFEKEKYYMVTCSIQGYSGLNYQLAETGVRAVLVEEATVYEGNGVSLAEAIEQSAGKIAADLPTGSRVAIVAWESASAGLSDYIMEELTGALVDGGMEVADRQNLVYVYKELDFQMSGVVSDESARSIGKFLGADMVITGQLTELGGPYRYRANAVNVENATRDSVTRLDVRGDAAMRRLVVALANQKPTVKTASYGEEGKTAPGTAGAFLDRGIILASQREFEMAIADFTEAIRLNSNLSAAYLLRGRAAYAGVSDVYDIAKNFAHVNARFSSGQRSREQTEAYDRAIADFTEALRMDGNNAVIYLNRGEAYAQKADYDKAIADFNQAIRHNLNYARAYISRGGAYFLKGDYDRAIVDFNQAIKVDPNAEAAYSNSGTVYRAKGEYDRAIADYNQALRINPNDAMAYLNRGIAYYGKGEYDRAIADCNQALQINPNLVEAYVDRGNVYSGKREHDRAIADYNQALRINPNDAMAYNNRGLAYRAKGEHDRAIADYNQALRINPNYANAYYNRGAAYHGKGEHDRAIADYNQALRINPNLAEAYRNRGWAYDDKGEHDRAIADYNQMLRINPNDAEAYHNRGWAYANKGNYARARVDWERVLQINPNDADARNNLELLRQMGY